MFTRNACVPMISLVIAFMSASTATAADSGDKYNDVLSHSQTLTALDLFQGSAKSLKADLYSASLQFFAAETRARTDFSCFPPVGTGGDSPMELLGTMREEIGEEVNPQIVKDASLYARVVERLKDWDPGTGPGYKPGWDYKSACSSYRDVAEGYKDKQLKFMGDMSTLLQIPEYKSAFDIAQSFHLAPYDEQQKPERMKQAHDAEDVILRIEKEKNLDVLTSSILKERKGN